MFPVGQSPIPNPCTASLPLPPRQASKVLTESETDLSMYEQYDNTHYNPSSTSILPCHDVVMKWLWCSRCYHPVDPDLCMIYPFAGLFSLFLLVLLVLLHPVALSKRFCHRSLFSLFGLLLECLIAWADCDCLSFWFFVSHTEANSALAGLLVPFATDTRCRIWSVTKKSWYCIASKMPLHC